MRPRLLSSVHGEIQEILIVFPGISTQASVWEYEGITEIFEPKGTVHRFQQAAPGCTIRVAQTSYRGDPGLGHRLNNFRTINDVDANLNLIEVLHRWREELSLIEAGGGLHYHRWAQDPFVTLAMGESIILLTSYYCQRLTDYLLPLQLAEQAGDAFLLKPTRWYFEGGNVLCDGDCAYIGRDLLQENERLFGLDEATVLAGLKQALGVDALQVIGMAVPRAKWASRPEDNVYAWQPLFHIDLFMTLGGWDRALGKQLVFLGNATLTKLLLPDRIVNGKRIYLPDKDPNLEEGLAEVHAQLLATDIVVVELPIYCLDQVCYSWNNCLVEVTAAARRVYLPSYRAMHDEQALNPTFEILEADVERRFIEAGFEPMWIRSGGFFRLIASLGGSLHCVTKVLRRGVYDPAIG